MRVMALDFGDVRIGVALSDPMKILASPLETYHRVGYKKDVAYLVDLAKQKEVSVIVVGLPLKLDGTDSEQTVKAREFGNAVQAEFEGKVVFIDERLTTQRAHREMIADSVRRDKRKKAVDMIAASFILQSYLDRG